MTGKVLQFGGSLAAILILAWIALKLGLGGDTRIRDRDHLRELADEALHGFDPVDMTIDRSGLAAVARDGDGRVMVLRRHGSHFVSRVLQEPAQFRRDGPVLVIETGDRRFGAVTLDLGDEADAWAERLRRV